MKRTIAVPALTVLMLSAALLSLPLAAQEGEEAMPAPQPQGPPPPANLTPPADAQTTASGLAYKVLQEGTGANHPDGNDLVVVNYTGWKADDGTVFNSSVARGKPELVPLEALIQGWTEGLQLMTEGAKWRLWIPGDLAYAGIEGRPQGMLVFDVELLEVREIPDPPEHLDGPPADATTESSGLAWKMLEPGIGEGHPGPGDRVKVNYIAWTPKGQWIDATYAKGSPSTLEFDTMIEGWKQALADMVPGEKRRLWVPGKLAYQNDPSKPQGPLVFDVKLLEINPES
jgi:FKBP-type peptidyl-prolyl cis-trans isomerase